MASTPRDRFAGGSGKVALYPLLQRVSMSEFHDGTSSKLSPSASSIGPVTSGARSRPGFGGISPGLSGYSFFATPPPISQDKIRQNTSSVSFPDSPSEITRASTKAHAPHSAMMCSGCGFFLSIPSPDATAFDFLQARFQRRCPTLLFALADSDLSGSLSKYEASRFLLKQGFETSNIEEILSQFQSDDLGSVHGEDFSKLCALAQTANIATISSAVRMVDPRRRLALQLYGSIVQPWGSPNPQQWNEQACKHLGIRGCVRLYHTGMLLSIAVFLQGQDMDIRAYVDALLSEEVCSNSEGLQISFRYVIEHADPVLTLSVTSHLSRNEMMSMYNRDLERFVSSGSIPIDVTGAKQSESSNTKEDESGQSNVQNEIANTASAMSENSDSPSISTTAAAGLISLDLNTVLKSQRDPGQVEGSDKSARQSPLASRPGGNLSPSSKQESGEKYKRKAATGMRNRQLYNWVSDSESDSEREDVTEHSGRSDSTAQKGKDSAGNEERLKSFISPRRYNIGGIQTTPTKEQKDSARSNAAIAEFKSQARSVTGAAAFAGFRVDDEIKQAASSDAVESARSLASPHASVLFDYIAQEADELTIRRGQGLKVLAMHADGWCLVQDIKGSCGVVPGNYLRYLNVDHLKRPEHGIPQDGKSEVPSSPGSVERSELLQWIASTQIVGQAFLEKLNAYRASSDHSLKGNQLGMQGKILSARESITTLMTTLIELSSQCKSNQPLSDAKQITPRTSDPSVLRSNHMQSEASRMFSGHKGKAGNGGADRKPPLNNTPNVTINHDARNNAITTETTNDVRRKATIDASDGGGASLDTTSSSSSDSYTFDLHPRSGALAPHAMSEPRPPHAKWSGAAKRGVDHPLGGPPLQDRSGDFSDGSDEDDDISLPESSGLKQWNRTAATAAAAATTDSLRPTADLLYQNHHPPSARRAGGDTVEASSVMMSSPWCVRLQLIEARDLPHREGAPPADLVCLISLLQLGAQPLTTAGSLSADHSFGPAAASAVSGRGAQQQLSAAAAAESGRQPHNMAVVEPQVRSKLANSRSLSPVWNQSFTLTDAIPNGRVLESMPRLGVRRVSVSGQAMLLLLTLHESPGAAATGGSGGGGPGSGPADSFYGRATEIIKPGPPEDHWVLVRSRAGVPMTGAAGRPSAVHLRVHYCRDPSPPPPSGGMINGGFWS